MAETEDIGTLGTPMVPQTELAKLLQAPVSPSTGKQLLSIFKDLKSGPDAEETAKLYRRAYFVLDNLGYADAQNYADERNSYATWFYGERKKLMESFEKAAESIEQVNQPEMASSAA